MIELQNIRRSMGARELFTGINLLLPARSLSAIIGRNGEGKSTLLRIIFGVDHDYEGNRTVTAGETIAFATQEAEGYEGETARESIKRRLPNYQKHNGIIENGHALLSGSKSDMSTYSDALEQFTQLGYFTIDAEIEKAVATIGLPESLPEQVYKTLSGGQQKLIDLAMIMVSPATTLLFDEPTNHMDAWAKRSFIDWLKKQSSTILIVTHDRDILDVVETIYELKDRKLIEYTGNYQAYLRQNRISTSTSIHQFEVDSRTVDKLKKQLVEAERKKLRCKSNPNPFVPLVIRLKKELDKTLEALEKPSAWIDQRSVADLKPDERKRYEKYKTTGLSLKSKHESTRGSGSTLLNVEGLSVGYDKALFQPVTFRLLRGEHLRLQGRNGVGKTSLIHAITDFVAGKEPATKCFSGFIEVAPKISIAEYKQHGEDEFRGKNLYEAIEIVLEHCGKTVNEQIIRRTLSQYLFDPMADASKEFEVLSGGEKARLNLMKLLLTAPDIMILDEPTNHLDLPSIEELESLLHSYDGAVLFVSHDSYFANELGGESVTLQPATS